MNEDKTQDLETVPGSMIARKDTPIPTDTPSPREPFWSEAQKKLITIAATVTALGALSGGAVKFYEKWQDTTANRKRIERLEAMVPVQCKMCWFQIHSSDADRVCAGDKEHPCWQFKPIESGK